MKEEILRLIREKGPVFPSEITNELKTNSLILSAYLTELIKEGKLFYSHKKVGNSPLYYIKGQEDLVRKRLYPELKIPERKIVDFFEKNKLVLKSKMTPQQRFMVDELRDFITPLTIKINGKEHLFYKHYSITTQQIYNELNRMDKKVEHKVVKKEEPKGQVKLFTDNKVEPIQEKKEERTVQMKKEVVKEEHNEVPIKEAEKIGKLLSLAVEKYNIVKKGKEIDLVGVVNNPIRQRYFVKYLNKKNINENDIGKVFVESQIKRMPAIIVTKGKITKGAKKVVSEIGDYIKVVKVSEGWI